jgi:hypothetical protein
MLKLSEKQVNCDTKSKTTFNGEIFIHFLKKNEKLKAIWNFYEKELPYNTQKILESIIQTKSTANQTLVRMNEFLEELNSIQNIDEFISTMPDGLRQILTHWKKI